VTSPLNAVGRTVTKLGAGAAQLARVNASALNVSAGMVRLSLKPTDNDPAGMSTLSSLSIAPGGLLDLTNNALLIDHDEPSVLSDLREHLHAGRLGSSQAIGAKQIGYADQPATSSVLVELTFGGDASLDGQVDVTDLGALATNWQSSGALWVDGDFNYDGLVDVSDLGILATNWQAGTESGSGSPLSAFLGLPTGSVPEPSLIGILTGGLLLCGRRRMSRQRFSSNES